MQLLVASPLPICTTVLPVTVLPVTVLPVTVLAVTVLAAMMTMDYAPETKQVPSKCFPT